MVQIRSNSPCDLRNVGLENPFLRIFAGPTAIAENGDWQVSLPLCQNTGHACDGPQEISATGLAPGNLFESAILITLAPGAYTAIVSGTGNSVGVGLVEVYEVVP